MAATSPAAWRCSATVRALPNPPPDTSPGESGSVARVRAALLAAGHADTITALPASARSAAEAAATIGCGLAQIAKSIVFQAGEQAAIVIASGAARVDMAKAAQALGRSLTKANATFVRSATGFAIGGVSPVGQTLPCLLLLDETLLTLDPLWAAAGSPHHVFQTTAAWLQRLTDAAYADVGEGPQTRG